MSNYLKKNALMLEKLEEMKDNIEYLSTHGVEVGIIRGDKTYPNGATVLEVANYQEYGNEDAGGNLPQRSFVGLMAEKRSSDGSIDKLAATVWQQVLFRNKKPKSQLNKAGTVLVSWVKHAIDTHGYGTWEPLAEKTERRKKRKNSPLVDSMLLYNSIDYSITGEK